jgi:hypothetical protein
MHTTYYIRKEFPMVFEARLRKTGSNYEVTLPESEVERLGLEEGEMLTIYVRRNEEGRVALSDDLKALFEESWKDNEAGYRYLAGR